jgi:hypothetical protein
MELNIFEPRYRLMVRRCVNGNGRFGMATLVNGDLHPVACECEILEAHPQADGWASFLFLSISSCPSAEAQKSSSYGFVWKAFMRGCYWKAF